MAPSPFAVVMYVIAALSGFAGVAAAALTSHGLQGLAPTGELAVEWFKIATNFEITHALGVILVTALAERFGEGRAQVVTRVGAILLAAGAVLFPTALYSLSFNGPAFWAPFGGTAAMGGWALFGVGAVMAGRKKPRA
jgi:uncharacterized membrane protein YgdD (TMEM256/DUF423 family)